MPFRVLTLLLTWFFFLSHTAWPISFLENLGLRFPVSIVYIQLLYNKGRAGFGNMLYSNSGSPEGPLPAFVLWNSASLIFLKLFHYCLWSQHYSLQKGRDLVLLCIPSAVSSEACELLVFVIQQILDWLRGSPKEPGSFLGTPASVIMQVPYVEFV